jgi:hypothetical protein
VTTMRTKRARLAAITAGVVASVVPVLSQSASAADQQCNFVLNTVQAIDVQEPRSRGDEIFIRLDGVAFPSSGSVRFLRNGVTRSANNFDSPVVGFADDNPLSVRLIEDDIIFNDPIGNTKNLECTGDQTDQVLVFKETGVKYLMKYDVDLLS